MGATAPVAYALPKVKYLFSLKVWLSRMTRTMADKTEERLRDLLEQAIRAKDQTEVERLLTEFRIVMSERVATARIALRSQRLLLDDL